MSLDRAEVRYALSLVFPSEGGGDLLGEGEGIEGLEENSGEAQAREASLIDSLNLGGEQENRDVGDGRVLLHGGEGSRAVDSGHHDVHEDRIGVLGCSDRDAFSA